MKRKLIFAAAVILVFLCLAGCEQLPWSTGTLEFPDYTDQTKLVGGNAGLMDFGGKLVPPLGERAVLPLNIKNSGSGSLLITNIHILQGSVPDDNPPDAVDAFSFIDGTFPSLPLLIPAGGTVNDIFIEFTPETAGDYSGKMYIETDTETTYIDLAARGLWQLKIDGDEDGVLYILGDDDADNIVIDGSSESGTASASDGVFTILCEPEFMREHQKWDPNAADIDFPTVITDLEFDNRNALKTTVILKSHAAILADIENPYVQVDPGDDIQAAINACAADLNNLPIAVALSAGTHNVSGNLTINSGVPIYGGYSSSWTFPRVYKTYDDRDPAETPNYATILNINGTINITGSTVKDNVVLEGFTINKSGGGDAPLIKYDDGTTAVLSYNTITSNGTDSSSAVMVTNSSAPLIKYNYIDGGGTSDDYSESHGIEITEGASPVIYANNIAGGTAIGDDSKAFAIFCDFECEPYIRNNTIIGGSAPGSGGKSYGIYIINNGHALVDYNSISGGSGGTAVAMYAKYGSYFKANNNNIFTTGGDMRIGVWADHLSRVYALTGNGIYNCSDALYRSPSGVSLKAIAAVNSEFNTDSNSDSAVDLSSAPTEAQYE